MLQRSAFASGFSRPDTPLSPPGRPLQGAHFPELATLDPPGPVSLDTPGNPCNLAGLEWRLAVLSGDLGIDHHQSGQNRDTEIGRTPGPLHPSLKQGAVATDPG